MKPNHLLYLFPASITHGGLHTKAHGQYKAFQTFFPKVSWLTLSKKSLLSWIFFEFKGLYKAFSPNITHIYMRYNAKSPLLNLALGLLAKYKTIYLEHNINYEKELKHLHRPLEKKLHHLFTKYFPYTQIIHVAVTPELTKMVQEWGVPKNRTHTLQNGYDSPPPTPPSKDTQHALTLIKDFAPPNMHTGILVGQGYRWHGLPEIAALIKNYPEIRLLVVGPYDIISHPQILYLGPIAPDQLPHLYEHCQFGVGTFRLDLIGLTQASPLKTREYLVHGLPILVNYHDTAADLPDLQDAVFNLLSDPQSVDKLLHYTGSKQSLKEKAKKTLSWTTRFADIFTHNI